MSNHDLTIANGPGINVRQDIEAALQALGTNFQGPASPLITYPCQLWADSSTGLLKIRNLANTAWVTVGVLDAAGFGLVPAGGAAGQALVKNTATNFDSSWQAVVPATRTVTGASSLTGGGDLSANRQIALVNDNNAPGANFSYGTDAANAKGWQRKSPNPMPLNITANFTMDATYHGRAIYPTGGSVLFVALPPPAQIYNGFYFYVIGQGGAPNWSFGANGAAGIFAGGANLGSSGILKMDGGDRGMMIFDGNFWWWLGRRNFYSPFFSLPANGGGLVNGGAHGLGTRLSGSRVILKCIAADIGYGVNDLVYLPGAYTEGSTGRGVTLIDNNDLTYSFFIGYTSPGMVSLIQKGGAAPAAITNARWQAQANLWVDN